MTVPHDTEAAIWTDEDEAVLQRRQRWNERAVTVAALLTAAVVSLGAIVSVYDKVDAASLEVAPPGPVDPLALQLSEGTRVGFENGEIAAVAGEALEQIRYPWRSELAGWSVHFLEPRGAASGYTWSREQRMEVFVEADDDVARVARVLAHELGHAVDVSMNTADERRAWLAERGAAPDTPWWPGSGRPDFETGAGDFAEVFAAWQIGDSDFKSRVNPVIDEGDYALIEQLSRPDR